MVLPLGGLFDVVLGVILALTWRVDVGALTIGGGVLCWLLWLIVFLPQRRALWEDEARSKRYWK